MSNRRTYCAAAARAIRELDRCSFGAPADGQDEVNWREARRLLLQILDRNGYELAATGSRRIKRRSTDRA
jgi:hypothetical protein